MVSAASGVLCADARAEAFSLLLCAALVPWSRVRTETFFIAWLREMADLLPSNLSENLRSPGASRWQKF